MPICSTYIAQIEWTKLLLATKITGLHDGIQIGSVNAWPPNSHLADAIASTRFEQIVCSTSSTFVFAFASVFPSHKMGFSASVATTRAPEREWRKRQQKKAKQNNKKKKKESRIESIYMQLVYALCVCNACMHVCVLCMGHSQTQSPRKNVIK